MKKGFISVLFLLTSLTLGAQISEAEVKKDLGAEAAFAIQNVSMALKGVILEVEPGVVVIRSTGPQISSGSIIKISLEKIAFYYIISSKK